MILRNFGVNFFSITTFEFSFIPSCTTNIAILNIKEITDNIYHIPPNLIFCAYDLIQKIKLIMEQINKM